MTDVLNEYTQSQDRLEKKNWAYCIASRPGWSERVVVGCHSLMVRTPAA